MDHETFRHQCEVRWLIAKGPDFAKRYFRGDGDSPGVGKIRGPKAARRLMADVKEQAALGNTGQPGDWRTTKETISKADQRGNP